MATDLWDKHGHAVAYIDGDKESIYMQDGTPAGWLSGSGIYTYSGKFLGWLYQGWIFGRDGKCVLFTERSQPGAVKPFRHPAIGRGNQVLPPSRATRDAASRRPERSTAWSSADTLSFFGIS